MGGHLINGVSVPICRLAVTAYRLAVPSAVTRMQTENFTVKQDMKKPVAE